MILVPWLLLLNAWTFAAFAIDKRRAIQGQHRYRESDLLLLAFLGGTPGALVARQVFRHKTRKQPFSTYLLVIAMVQIGAAIGLLMPPWR